MRNLISKAHKNKKRCGPHDPVEMFDCRPGYGIAYHDGLMRVRHHIVSLSRAVQPGGSHDEECYHFYAGTGLLMSLFDGIAVYVEKKPGARWSNSDFPRFASMRAIQQRTEHYMVEGGVTADTLRDVSRQYLPWILTRHAAHGTLAFLSTLKQPRVPSSNCCSVPSSTTVAWPTMRCAHFWASRSNMSTNFVTTLLGHIPCKPTHLKCAGIQDTSASLKQAT
jgi:hypothetical protein